MTQSPEYALAEPTPGAGSANAYAGAGVGGLRHRSARGHLYRDYVIS